MDLQPDLQRQLYAARDPAHHGGRCAAVPRGPADLRPSGTLRRSFFKESIPPFSDPRRAHALRGFLLQKILQKTVDKRPCGWYNYTRRQAQDKTSGGLAQLGERLHGMQEVTGSIPVISTNEEQNEHEVTIQMVGNVFVLFCEIPSV